MFSLKRIVVAADAAPVCDYLARCSALSKSRIKDALNKGAVWLTRADGRRRLRRATALLRAGDRIELHYDPVLLSRSPPASRCIEDARRYSVWYKPAGVMAQGTDFGDHCALLRQAELYFHARRPVFLVHRLDRETEGLMLIAHDREAAARLSALFREGRIRKIYRARVRGVPAERMGVIDLPLDGKRALSSYRVRDCDAAAEVATLEVEIATGRTHQIRRHLALIGHAVLGDPRYGRGNKDSSGLQLAAVALHFRCPLGGGDRHYSVQGNFAAEHNMR
jgi:tRNA pseudouridine32 synthase/23S rRNA pseudouridine746 synthase